MPFVRSYRRSDGARVRGHWRTPAGARKVAAVAVVAVALALFIRTEPGDSSREGRHHRSAAAAMTAPSPVLGATGRIVQVSSHRDASLARQEARQLRARGLPAGVFVSDRYRGYRSGYFVVYVGPYPSTMAGRSTARKVSAGLAGSRVADVRAR